MNALILNTGYKLTNIGDREVKKLGDLFELNRSKPTIKSNEAVTFLGMEDISEEGQVINNENVLLFSEIKKGLTHFKRNDVLVAKITPCFENGKGAFLNNLKTENGFGSTEFHVLGAKENVVPRYVYYHTQTKNFRKKLETEMIGTAGQKRVPLKAIINFPLTVIHSKTEQAAISTALSDVDALINGLGKLIAKKRDIKQATMQQLLTGKQRLPGFKGEWVVKHLGDVLKVRHGKSQHDVVENDGQYPILATGGEIGRTNKYLYDKPSVLIGRKGTIDSPQFVNLPFWTIDTLFFTEISDLAEPKFIFFKFNMINWKSYNEASGVPSLNASTIESIDFNYPSLSEQTAIATVLSDMDAEIATLEQKRDKTRALKEGMMQELLTGKKRLL